MARKYDLRPPDPELSQYCPHRDECSSTSWPGLGAWSDDLSSAAGGTPFQECSCRPPLETPPKKKLTPYQRIVRAAERGTGLHLSDDDVMILAQDSGIDSTARLDDEIQKEEEESTNV